MAKSLRQKFPRVAFILWLDACADNEWGKAEEVEPPYCYTLGFVLHEGEDYYVLGLSLDEEDEANGMMAIPKGMIQAMFFLPDGFVPSLLKALELQDFTRSKQEKSPE